MTTFGRAKLTGDFASLHKFVEDRHRFFGASDVVFVEGPSAAPDTGDEFAVRIHAVNPLTDFDAVRRTFERLVADDANVGNIDGCIPGTGVDQILRGQGTRSSLVTSDTQRRFNTQLNVYKFKRLKQLQTLIALEPQLHTFTIDEVIAALRRHRDAMKFYGIETSGTVVSKCPSCGADNLDPILATASQPLIGFVLDEDPLYSRCLACGLGFMSPHVPQHLSERLYERYDTFDTATSEAELERTIMDAPLPLKNADALALVEPLLPPSARTLDVGGGSGRVSFHAKRRNPNWSVVHSDYTSLQHSYLSENGVEQRVLNIATDSVGTNEFDLISAFEVIEHLDFATFEHFVHKAHAALRPGGYLLLTTPDLDSPLVTAFDFFNAYAPHHFLLFSRRWLEGYFAKPELGFRISSITSAADLLDDYESYFSYYASTSPTWQQRSSAQLLRRLLAVRSNRELLVREGYGSEVVVLLKRDG